MIFMMFGSIVTLDGGYIPYIPFIYPVMYNPWFIYKPNKQPGFVFFSRAHYFPQPTTRRITMLINWAQEELHLRSTCKD